MTIPVEQSMPNLIIDDIRIEVPEGTKVLEAAERLGIMIPRFCFHPALGSVGACRVCAVKFVEGPVKGIAMSCMEDARDGMVISTTDPEVVNFRKYVIEWLMLNHPHDCPVCDEGGHCLLQDQTVSGGHGIRRYLGKKRTYHDQNIGPFVQHEMNRCIHCFRCRRFYQEFSGYRDLGAMQIGNRMYFGRFTDGSLESPFSGNLIDVCPTGVYTDKPARFKGRRWDFERAPSVCLHCSLGCNTTGSARYREIVRQEARVNERVNGYFICDRGRFGFGYTHHPDRPRSPQVAETEVPWDAGIKAAAAAMSRVGPAVACLGSTRSSLETQAALKRLCRLQGWPDPRFFPDPAMADKVKKAVSRLNSHMAMSMEDIEKADFILAVGADPLSEAPMLALAMRQAYRRGATVAIIDPRPLSLPFDFDHLAVAHGHLGLCLRVLTKKAVSRKALEGLGPEALKYYDALPVSYPSDPRLEDRLTEIGQKLQACQRPVIVCGTDIVRATTPALAADLALVMSAMTKGAGLFYILPGPNAFGAALLSPPEEPASLLQSIEKGDIKCLLLVDCDLFRHFPDHQNLERTLDHLECLIVMDYLPSKTVQQANIFLPTTTVFEGVASSFVNQEGRLQVASPVHAGGTPMALISEGKHPPRNFLHDIPGGEPKSPPDIFKDLSIAVSGQGDGMCGKDLRTWLAREDPAFSNILSADPPAEGQRLIPEEDFIADFSLLETITPEAIIPPEDHLLLLLVDQTFGSEELSAYSNVIQQVEKPPQLTMHREDAGRLGLSDGDKVSLLLDEVSVKLELKLSETMAPGVMVLPRHRQLFQQGMTNRQMTIPTTSIKRFE
jgi:NADH-quinone oxidoreductase subunit G